MVKSTFIGACPGIYIQGALGKGLRTKPHVRAITGITCNDLPCLVTPQPGKVSGLMTGEADYLKSVDRMGKEGRV